MCLVHGCIGQMNDCFVLFFGCVVRWVDGWTVVFLFDWLNGWLHESVGRWLVDQCVDSWLIGWMMDGWMMNGWVGGYVVGWTFFFYWLLDTWLDGKVVVS